MSIINILFKKIFLLRKLQRANNLVVARLIDLDQVLDADTTTLDSVSEVLQDGVVEGLGSGQDPDNLVLQKLWNDLSARVDNRVLVVVSLPDTVVSRVLEQGGTGDLNWQDNSESVWH